MLVIKDEAYFHEVIVFADHVGARDRLQRQLDRLAAFSGDESTTRCLLHRDFAAHSFAFLIETRSADGSWRTWFNGGLIYSGPGQPLDGSFPALTVSLDRASGVEHDWSIHT
jgi:hypothetical protein